QSDIYRSVINDVIAQVKEAFLDESIDIDVLNQLKKDWEEKIAHSGCVEMDPKPAPPANSMRAVNAAAGVQQPMQAGMNNMQGAYMQAGRVVPMQQYAGLVQGGVAMPQNIMVLSGGRMLVQQQMQQAQQDHVHQLDGSGALRDDVPCSSASLKEMKKRKKKATKPTRKEAEKVARQLGLLQLDGGKGGGMSDSSSEEEEEEEDDPLRRIADRIGDEGEGLDEDGVHEDPLNSDDDQSDDEDLVTLFDAEDVVMCQFEKFPSGPKKIGRATSVTN
ncbi:hypothetical protein PENTCL1PPCAC_47, partial [Pristionchus entomophagus]